MGPQLSHSSFLLAGAARWPRQYPHPSLLLGSIGFKVELKSSGPARLESCSAQTRPSCRCRIREPYHLILLPSVTRCDCQLLPARRNCLATWHRLFGCSLIRFLVIQNKTSRRHLANRATGRLRRAPRASGTTILPAGG